MYGNLDVVNQDVFDCSDEILFFEEWHYFYVIQTSLRLLVLRG